MSTEPETPYLRTTTNLVGFKHPDGKWFRGWNSEGEPLYNDFPPMLWPAEVAMGIVREKPFLLDHIVVRFHLDEEVDSGKKIKVVLE